MSTAVPVWNPPLLPKSRLKDRPLVQFTTDGLRTGGCFVPLAWNGRIFFVTYEQYEQLKEKLPHVGEKKKAKRPPRDESTGGQRDEDDCVSVEWWDFPTVSSPFNRDEWATVPLPCMPGTPQPAPLPLQWDSLFTPLEWGPSGRTVPDCPPQEWYSSLHRSQFIPNLCKRTSAKTDKGRGLFGVKMTALWAERKALFALWRKTIPYNAKHSDSEGVPETPLRCARCGCSIFSDKIICRDCGFSMRFFDRSQRKNRWQTGGDEPCFQEYAFDPMLNNRPPAVSDTDGLSDIEGRKGRALRRRPQVTIDAFARLLASQRGGLERLTDEKELRRAAYTMWLLVDHRIQCKDVAAILGESVNTVESRVRRAADALDELKAENRPLKEIHPVSAVLLSMRYREAFEKVCPQYRGENSRLLTKLVSDACAKS